MISRTLSAGNYTIEATTWESQSTGSFTLTVSGIGGVSPTPTPTHTPTLTHTPTATATHTTHKHQSDHTVRVVVDNPTALPTVFRTAIPKALEAWKDTLATSVPNLDLRLCQSSETGCATDNMDGYVVNLNLVAGRK